MHGLSQTLMYRIYNGIKRRCNSKISDHYKYYGGKGIECKWLTIQDFIFDMGDSYEKHFIKNNGDTTIERIDVNGNYCKENCTWITKYEQYLNKTNNIFIEYNGKKQTISQWGNELLISRHALYARYKTYNGNNISDILLKPTTKNKSYEQFKHGFKIDSLTIIKEIDKKGKYRYFQLSCICGKIVERNMFSLGRHKTTSCGCLGNNIGIGNTYGLLTIIGEGKEKIDNRGYKIKNARCKCYCGNEKDIILASLKNGSTRSCGCYNSRKNRNVSIDEYKETLVNWIVNG